MAAATATLSLSSLLRLAAPTARPSAAAGAGAAAAAGMEGAVGDQTRRFDGKATWCVQAAAAGTQETGPPAECRARSPPACTSRPTRARCPDSCLLAACPAPAPAPTCAGAAARGGGDPAPRMSGALRRASSLLVAEDARGCSSQSSASTGKLGASAASSLVARLPWRTPGAGRACNPLGRCDGRGRHAAQPMTPQPVAQCRRVAAAPSGTPCCCSAGRGMRRPTRTCVAAPLVGCCIQHHHGPEAAHQHRPAGPFRQGLLAVRGVLLRA
jgi:hypothetical protein